MESTISVICILSGICFLIGTYVSTHRNRYRLRCFVYFLCGFILLLLGLLLWNESRDLNNQFLFIFIGLFVIFLLMSAVFTVLSLFLNSVRLIKREGFSLTNILGILILAIMFITDLSVGLFPDFLNTRIGSVIFAAVTVMEFYFVMLAAVFLGSTIFVLLFPQRKPADYVIVLGSGLIKGTEVSPLLASRIDAGIRLYKKSPEHTKLVMSGGQGPDEAVPEGQAMAEYAIRQGIPSASVLIENKSKNTKENMAFSQEIIKQDTQKEPVIAYATSWYHVYRAGIYAHECGMNIRGVGGKVKFYFGQNALIREFIAVFVQNHVLQILLEIIVLASAVLTALTF